MSIESGELVSAVVIGAGATFLMDLWNLFLRRAFGLPSLDYCLLGRWISHMPAGTLRHASISAAAPKRFECPIGWMAHYSIGIAFALVFVTLMSGEWLARPTLPPALLFGIATVVFPYFIMQPSLGLGVAASRAPRPAQARFKSLMSHAVFGAGLYLVGLVLTVT
jgi:hypothetical protein